MFLEVRPPPPPAVIVRCSRRHSLPASDSHAHPRPSLQLYLSRYVSYSLWILRPLYKSQSQYFLAVIVPFSSMNNTVRLDIPISISTGVLEISSAAPPYYDSSGPLPTLDLPKYPTMQPLLHNISDVLCHRSYWDEMHKMCYLQLHLRNA